MIVSTTSLGTQKTSESVSLQSSVQGSGVCVELLEVDTNSFVGLLYSGKRRAPR